MKNIMKIASVLLALVLALVLSFAACGKTETPETTPAGGDTTSAETLTTVKKVGIIQYISHPSLDNCYAGVEAALKERFGDKVEITRQIGSDTSADTDCGTYASQFAAQNYDMIVAIATPAASSAVAAAEDKDIPVVFCAVSDPMAIGLVESMDKPGFNCSGTSDVLDMEAQVKLIRAMQPDVKKIGVLYTTSEANSITQLGLLEDAAKAYGIEVIASGIQNDADIPAAATGRLLQQLHRQQGRQQPRRRARSDQRRRDSGLRLGNRAGQERLPRLCLHRLCGARQGHRQYGG